MSSSALVLIEFQRQWTDPGLYHRLIRKQLDSRSVLANTRSLARSARSHDATVIHVPLVIDPSDKQGWFGRVTLGKVFTKDTPRAELTEGLFEEGDLLAEGRTRFDAFEGSQLENVIRDGEFDRLYFCGITTEYCVAKSMRTAAKLGFENYLVSDCTVTRNRRIQRRIEAEFEPNVLTSRDVINRLENAKTGVPSASCEETTP